MLSLPPMNRLPFPSLATLLIVAFGFLAPRLHAEDAVLPQQVEFPLQAERILFLGDSITHADQYVSLIETQLRISGLDPLPQIINLGLSSETCSGLSEPDHPFPRPDIHRRLDRALAIVQPDLVVACYGMNDGIYHPFDEQRFAAYRDGITRLVDKVHAAGAKIVLMTPPPFDPLPLKDSGKLLPAGEAKYAYFAVYENYDDVVRRYGEWLLGHEDAVAPPAAEMVIDLHGPIRRFLAEKRTTDPAFTVAGDGVHPNGDGHRMIAKTVLRAWGVDNWHEPPEALQQLMFRRGRLLHDAWLSHVGHDRPGSKPGPPLEEAVELVAALEMQITPLVQEARGSTASNRTATDAVEP